MREFKGKYRSRSYRNHSIIQRVVVGILTVALLAEQMGTLTVYAHANTEVMEETKRIISDFSELPEEVREQSVSVGTALDELVLPDTLEATVLIETEKTEETEEEKNSGEEKDKEETENPEEKDPEEPENPEEKDPEETENPEGTENSGETENPEGTENSGETENPEETENSGETENPEGTENSGESENPEETDNSGETEDSNPADTSDTEGNTSGQGTEDKGSENQESDTSTGDTAQMKTATFTVSLEKVCSSPSEEQSVETLIRNDSEPASKEQAADVDDETEEETITIENVTWTSSPEYDGETMGEYIFTPKLPGEGYILSEDASLPQITVTVVEEEQTAVPQISGWYFDEEYVAPKGDLFYEDGSYSIDIAGGDSEVQIPFEDITSLFPEKVTVEFAKVSVDGSEGEADTEDGADATDDAEMSDDADALSEEELSILGWECPEYTEDEEGILPYSGRFFFTARLGKDGEEKEYAYAEDVEQVGVWLVFDEPMTAAAVTAMPGTITSDQEWGEQTLAAGTYTINPGVTVTVSGVLTVSGSVTINGGGKLVRAGSYTGTDQKSGRYNNLLYVSSGNLTLENITIDGNKVNAYGPAVFIDSGTVNMNSNAVIQDNYNMNTNTSGGTYAAGGVYCAGTLNINGGTIRNCKTLGNIGSHVYNYAGGGIYLKGICNMNSGSITGNSASNGGGIYLASTGARLIVKGGTISGNKVNSSGAGMGVYYSTLNNATSILSIGGEGNIQDNIYLDNTGGTLCPKITSALRYKITLKCSSREEGKVLAKGNGYTLTGVDASKVTMADSTLFSRLDKANNQIILSSTEEAEAEWQETSGGAWKTGKFTTALANVYSGGTIRLLTDIVFNEKVLVDKTVTITSKDSSKPCTITRMPVGQYGNITLTGSGNLTLTNIIYDGNRDYISGEGMGQSLIKVGDGASDTGVSLTLGSGCTIRDGYKTGGSGVIAIYGNMAMNSGAVIENCEVSGTGGAVWVSSNGTFTMNGGTIKSCKAGGGGSAVSVDGTCTLKGGTITGNTDTSDKNCAVYLRSSGSGRLTLNGVSISGNTYSVYNDGKSVSVTGNSTLSGSIYTTNAITASGTAASGLTSTYTIKMNSVTDGTTVVTGSKDTQHYKLDNASYGLIPGSGTSLIAGAAYTITYNKNSGTITNESNYTSYVYGQGLTLPTPVRTGYTFGGWYTSSNFTGSAVTAVSTTDTGNKTFYAKWTGSTVRVTFDYQGGTGSPAYRDMTYQGTYGTLPTPTRTGYAFKGWYTQTGGMGSKVSDTTVVDKMTAHTLYAYWKDETAPDAPVLKSGTTLPTGWTRTQKTIPLTLRDGVGVTELWVSIDGSTYTKVSGFTSGSTSYTYTVKEGDHKYQFYAKDAAGNQSGTSTEFRVKLDTDKPVIGELTYANKAADLWQWIIGKKSLLIYVPVTDTGSGVTQISYTMAPVDAGGNPMNNQAETKTASVKNGTATISFNQDFKGTIVITCTDAAGNQADSVTVSAGGGVIVEDNAPVVRFSVNGGAVAGSYYDTAPDITVTVTDHEDESGQSMIAGGIASVSYQVGIGGSTKTVDHNYTANMVTSDSFIIPAGEIPAGEIVITVTAGDHAGNVTPANVTVRVKGAENTPQAAIDYREEKLTGLAVNGQYTINNAAYTADAEGKISIESSWFDTTLSIVKKGNNSTALDSAPQSLPVPARPNAPVPEAASRTDIQITLRQVTGVRYRMNGGEWREDPVFTGLTARTKYTFEAFYPSTANSFRSSAGSAEIATCLAAPTADSGQDYVRIDYEKETFTIPEGVEAFKDPSCTQPITTGDEHDIAEYIGGGIYIRYPAEDDFPASAPAEIPVKDRPSVPVANGRHETYPGAGNGAVTGLTEGTAYEISNDGGNTWTDAVLSGTEITGLTPGSYQVRVKAGEDHFRSDASAAVTIDTTRPTEEGTPQAGIDYENDTLTGLAPGAKYEVSYTTPDGIEHTQERTADVDGTIKFDEDWHGQSVEIVKKGNDKDKLDSAPQSLTIPARPSPPKPGTTGESGSGQNNGAITNLTPGETYQISEDGGKTWQDVTADDEGEIKELAPGSYEIRIKAKDDTFNSESIKCDIKAYPTPGNGSGSGGSHENGNDDVLTGSLEGDDGNGSDKTAGMNNSQGTSLNTGAIWKEVEKNEKVPDTEISMTTGELAAVVLTEAERQSVKNGSTVKILLIVDDATDTVSSQDKAVMNREKGDYVIGQYLDISLFKVLGDNREKIVQTNGLIRITIAVPEELKNTSRTMTREFAIIRVHDGEAVILDDLDNDEDTVTIETNLFSSYALLYRDVTGNAKTGRDDEPKTDDYTPLELYATLEMIAGLAYLLLYFADGSVGMTEEEKKELVSRIIKWAHRGGKLRRNVALVAIFLLLVYYHSIGKKTDKKVSNIEDWMGMSM